MASDLEADIELLSHTRSAKRRAGAKRLRSRGDPSAGPALLAALEKELQDSRTWETQYQMIMAIGHCGYTEALPFLQSLASRRIGVMIDLAIGDAMLRLSKNHSDDADLIVSLIESRQPLLAEGAIQAMAMLRMVPDVSTCAGSSTTACPSSWATVTGRWSVCCVRYRAGPRISPAR